MKYIDSDRLIDKILQLQKEYAQTEAKEDHKVMKAVLGGQCYTLTKVVEIIESLQDEQPEVDLDLDKELDRYYGVYRKDGKTYDIEDGEECEDWKEMFDPYNTFVFARHFYELGKLNARKEE